MQTSVSRIFTDRPAAPPCARREVADFFGRRPVGRRPLAQAHPERFSQNEGAFTVDSGNISILKVR